MNKLKILLPILLILALLLAVPAMAEEAEDLTAGLTVKVVDKPGKIKATNLSGKAATERNLGSFFPQTSRSTGCICVSRRCRIPL